MVPYRLEEAITNGVQSMGYHSKHHEYFIALKQ